jgi:quinol monooxygenase YgiN
MTKVAVFSKLTARSGREDALARVLGELVERAATETGTLVYSLHRDQHDPAVHWFYELYLDEGALAAHREGPAVRWVMPQLGDLLAGPPDIVFAEPLRAHGIPDA